MSDRQGASALGAKAPFADCRWFTFGQAVKALLDGVAQPDARPEQITLGKNANRERHENGERRRGLNRGLTAWMGHLSDDF